jgi:2'-5' RNA ligase
MDHVVIPLDRDHVAARALLLEGLATAIGMESVPEQVDPHVTVVAYEGLDAESAVAALAGVAAGTEPFTMHSHGYGFFTDDDPIGLNLHVPVVREPALEALHQAVSVELAAAGADIAGWTTPWWWSPHITLVDRGLRPDSLAAGAEWLAGRHHPSWRIPVDHLLVVGGWRSRDTPGARLRLGRA